MNIRLEYLYRDAGNFKNWGAVVFSNPNNIPSKSIAELASSALIDRSYFVAGKVGVPDLHFLDHDVDLDHDWHEFDSFQETEAQPDDSRERTIEKFIESLKAACDDCTA